MFSSSAVVSYHKLDLSEGHVAEIFWQKKTPQL